MKKAIILAMVLAAGLAHGQMFAQMFGGSTAWTPAALNPVAWWSFESTNGAVNIDSIGGNAMTLVGSPAVDTGIRGNCITTASGKYGSFTSFPSNTSFSISMWVKKSDQSAAGVILGSNISGDNNSILYSQTETQFRVRYVNGGDRSYTTQAIGTGWRMITVTCDGFSTRVYMDAIESTSGSQTTINPSIFAFNQIGRYSTGTAIPFVGQIDELTIYNYTLSRSQITQLFEYK